MRTTVRIDDDLLDSLKARASAEKVSLTRLINRVIKAGLASTSPKRPRRPYRERVQSMGTPRLALDKRRRSGHKVIRGGGRFSAGPVPVPGGTRRQEQMTAEQGNLRPA